MEQGPLNEKGKNRTDFLQDETKYHFFNISSKVDKECSKLIKTFSVQILFFEIQINIMINIIVALGGEKAPTEYLFVLLSHLLLCTVLTN